MASIFKTVNPILYENKSTNSKESIIAFNDLLTISNPIGGAIFNIQIKIVKNNIWDTIAHIEYTVSFVENGIKHEVNTVIT